MYYYNDNDGKMTKDKIFAEALIQIIDNQYEIKRKLGIVNGFADCSDDMKVVSRLQKYID